jgi:hypothetical protein
MFDTQIADDTGWTAVLLGLFMFFAAVGALRRPGLWQGMVAEFERSPALQLLASLVELLIGSVIYLLNPWVVADPLTCVMKLLGGLMVIEALVVVGFSDAYLHFWLRNLSFMKRGWPIVTLIAGVALMAWGGLRFD